MIIKSKNRNKHFEISKKIRKIAIHDHNILVILTEMSHNGFIRKIYIEYRLEI